MTSNAKVNGNGKIGVLIKSFLSKANLNQDQEGVVDFIISLLEADEESNIGGVLEGLGRASGNLDGLADRSNELNPIELESIQNELEDLREANDTVAAALGSCPLCWGGDRSCSNCQGRGHPGYKSPDPALFNQLVMPAVRRVHSDRRAPEATGYYRRAG